MLNVKFANANTQNAMEIVSQNTTEKRVEIVSLCREEPLTTQSIRYHFKFLALMLHMFFFRKLNQKILSAQIIYRKFPSHLPLFDPINE